MKIAAYIIIALGVPLMLGFLIGMVVALPVGLLPFKGRLSDFVENELADLFVGAGNAAAGIGILKLMGVQPNGVALGIQIADVFLFLSVFMPRGEARREAPVFARPMGPLFHFAGLLGGWALYWFS